MTAATAAGIAPPAPRKSSWDDLRGIVKGNGARFTIEEINDAIAEAGAAAGMAGMNDHDGDCSNRRNPLSTDGGGRNPAALQESGLSQAGVARWLRDRQRTVQRGEGGAQGPNGRA